MWKEVIVANFYVLFCNLNGGICKNTKDISNFSQPASTDLNTGPPEYGTAMMISGKETQPIFRNDLFIFKCNRNEL
jgi:hypothetical protein